MTNVENAATLILLTIMNMSIARENFSVPEKASIENLGTCAAIFLKKNNTTDVFQGVQTSHASPEERRSTMSIGACIGWGIVTGLCWSAGSLFDLLLGLH